MSGRKGEKHGLGVYASVYHFLRKPATPAELADKFSLNRINANELLREMKGLGLVHVCDWRRVGSTGNRSRVFKAGAGVDAPLPPTRLGEPSRTPHPAPLRPRAHLIAFKSVLEALDAGLSREQMSQETGLSMSCLQRLIKHMREIGMVRICAWRTSNPRIPLYELGWSPDHPKPPPMTNAEICKRRRERSAERRVNSIFLGIRTTLERRSEA